MNGNEKPPSAADNNIANNKASTPIKNPKTANSIFIAISQANPSKSQLNMSPGNLINIKKKYKLIKNIIYNIFEFMFIISSKSFFLILSL